VNTPQPLFDPASLSSRKVENDQAILFTFCAAGDIYGPGRSREASRFPTTNLRLGAWVCADSVATFRDNAAAADLCTTPTEAM
jgi:hypothetical protein